MSFPSDTLSWIQANQSLFWILKDVWTFHICYLVHIEKISVPGHPEVDHFSRWQLNYKKTVSCRRNSQCTFYLCAYSIYTNVNYNQLRCHWDDNYIRFKPYQHALRNVYCLVQSVCRHVVPLGHIILNPSQPTDWTRQ
jgi:hypothetical protein